MKACDSYGAWLEEDHDDLVLAVALACWYGVKRRGGRVVFTAATREVVRPADGLLGMMGTSEVRLDLRGY